MRNNNIKFSITKKDFEITWFSGTGCGGQNRNKNQNCCRLKHKDTGIITTGQSQRDRISNQKEALQGMANNKMFRAYCEQRLREIEEGQTLQEWAEEQMNPENLKVEVRNEEGKWVEWNE